MPIFHICDEKHRLWVLARTSPRRFERVPTINVLSKNAKDINFFQMKLSIFANEKNMYMYIACASSCNLLVVLVRLSTTKYIACFHRKEEEAKRLCDNEKGHF